MRLPLPEVGLVIRYSYLWLREHHKGREEGVKDRPCAIVLSAQSAKGHTRVRVVPVTHTPPADGTEAVELPTSVKRLLGLDLERSWVVISESNLFTWPGPDLRRVPDRGDASVAYGILPPRLFSEIKQRFLVLSARSRGNAVPRSE